MTDTAPDPARDTEPVDTRPDGARETDAYEAQHSAQSRLFDLRLVIGGLFAVYGVILTVVGLFAGPAEIAKSVGIDVNLWLGVGLLVVSALFLVWRRLRPAGSTPSTPQG